MDTITIRSGIAKKLANEEGISTYIYELGEGHHLPGPGGVSPCQETQRDDWGTHQGKLPAETEICVECLKEEGINPEKWTKVDEDISQIDSNIEYPYQPEDEVEVEFGDEVWAGSIEAVYLWGKWGAGIFEDDLNTEMTFLLKIDFGNEVETHVAHECASEDIRGGEHSEDELEEPSYFECERCKFRAVDERVAAMHIKEKEHNIQVFF
jgi:hypothetical protein